MADCRIPPGKICKTRGGSRTHRLSRADVVDIANACGIDEYHVKDGRRKKKTMDDLCAEIRASARSIRQSTKAKRPRSTKAKRPKPKRPRREEEEKLPPVSIVKKRTRQLSYDEAWKLLTTTYNTNILDDLTPSVRKRFYDYADNETMFAYDQQAKVSEDVNTVLVQLILNHKDNDKPVVKTISGPHTLSQHYSPETHKTIYIFGEAHLKESECRNMRGDLPVSDYLEDLFLTTDVFIDFYVEIGDTAIQQGAYDFGREDLETLNDLASLTDMFGPCIPKFMQKIPKFMQNIIQRSCDLARVHYADVRDIGGRRIIHEFFMEYWRTRYWYRRSGSNIPTIAKEVLRLLDGMTRSDFESFVVGNFLGNSIVMKEIQRSLCPDLILTYFTALAKELARNEYPDMARSVHSLFQVLSGKKTLSASEIEIFNRTLSEKGKTMSASEIEIEFERLLKVLFVSEIEIELERLLKVLVRVDTVNMDAYTMSRVFKRFRVSKNKPQPKVPHNIIIYAGNAHSMIYRDFLKFIGFQLVAQTTPGSIFKKDGVTPSRCVRMGNFPQPLFSSF